MRLWVGRSIADITQARLRPVQAQSSFFGPWVVRATFVMAMFGWGVGFYGPSIFLHTVVERTGWSLALVSTAVTLHYLFGALVVTRLPVLHRRFGVGPTAVVGAAGTALGVLGWSVVDAPWQLFASALISGAGWVTMGAVAVNAAIAPWYSQGRPMALAKAYNGASIGGVVFSPLWVLLIAHWGFTTAATMVGLTMIAVMVALERGVYARTPEGLGQCPDGDAPSAAAASANSPKALVLTGRLLWRDRGFVTLALGMAAGLFAQIGLLAHLFSLLVPALGAQAAGLAMGFATAFAIGGRLIVASILPSGANRRNGAALAYGVQLMGSMLLLLVNEQQTLLILLSVALFGSGIGNATSLPPLIAQAEFAKEDVPRVVALIVALGQATYAFAPATFGLVLSASAVAGARIGSGTPVFFLAVAVVQGIAILCFLAGRRRA
jgi:MFS family permease